MAVSGLPHMCKYHAKSVALLAIQLLEAKDDNDDEDISRVVRLVYDCCFKDSILFFPV